MFFFEIACEEWLVFHFEFNARQNPDYNVWVVSPRGTSGTAVMSAEAVPGHFKLLLPVMMPVCVMHPLEDGTDRYMKTFTGNFQNEYPSGTFLASKHGTTGKVADQTSLRSGKRYADRRKQQAAFEALSQYAEIPMSLFTGAATNELTPTNEVVV